MASFISIKIIKSPIHAEKNRDFSIIDYFVNELIVCCQKDKSWQTGGPGPQHRQLAADASETKPGIMIVSRHGPPSAQVVRRGNTKLWENLAAQAPLKHIASWNKGEPFIIMWNYLKFNVKTKFQLLLQKSIIPSIDYIHVWYNTKENRIYYGVRSREENPLCLGK